MDICIYSSAPYTYLLEQIEGFVNEELYHDGETILEIMETYYE